MASTGNTFIDYVLLAITFLPLAPVLLIIFQKEPGKEPLNFLMMLCLLAFIKNIPTQINLLHIENQNITNNIFSLLELVLLIRIFRDTLGKKIKDALNIFQVAVLSSLLTWFSILGWGQNSLALDSLLSAILIGIILLSLPPLVQARGLHIFQSPLFFIASGTLFYFLIAILLEWVRPSSPLPEGALNMENRIFLAIAALVRYLLYMLAILVSRTGGAVEKQQFS